MYLADFPEPRSDRAKVRIESAKRIWKLVKVSSCLGHRVKSRCHGEYGSTDFGLDVILPSLDYCYSRPYLPRHLLTKRKGFLQMLLNSHRQSKLTNYLLTFTFL